MIKKSFLIILLIYFLEGKAFSDNYLFCQDTDSDDVHHFLVHRGDMYWLHHKEKKPRKVPLETIFKDEVFWELRFNKENNVTFNRQAEIMTFGGIENLLKNENNAYGTYRCKTFSKKF